MVALLKAMSSSLYSMLSTLICPETTCLLVIDALLARNLLSRTRNDFDFLASVNSWAMQEGRGGVLRGKQGATHKGGRHVLDPMRRPRLAFGTNRREPRHDALRAAISSPRVVARLRAIAGHAAEFPDAGRFGCAGEIARYRAVQDNDLAMGHVAKSVYNQIKREIDAAEKACAAGQDAEATAMIHASETRHGYPTHI